MFSDVCERKDEQSKKNGSVVGCVRKVEQSKKNGLIKEFSFEIVVFLA